MKKWANELEQRFLKGRSPNGKNKTTTTTTKNHMKKFSISLAIKEMQLKTTL
jgi:hypothetical protein